MLLRCLFIYPHLLGALIQQQPLVELPPYRRVGEVLGHDFEHLQYF